MLETYFLQDLFCPGLEIFKDFDDHICLKLTFCRTPLSATRDFDDHLCLKISSRGQRGPAERDFDDHLCLKLAFCSIPLSGTRDFDDYLYLKLACYSISLSVRE